MDHGTDSPGRQADPVELVVSRLRERGCNPRPSGSRPGQWSAKCPAHDDRKPSLSLGTGDDGRALLSCKKGCGIGAITTALGLRLLDLHFHDHRGKPASGLHYDALEAAINAQAERIGGAHVATYRYSHADGIIAFVMTRYGVPGGKQVFPFHRGRGGRWKIGALRGMRPLYRLPSLVEALARTRASKFVVVVEGEKCVDIAADRLGAIATTSAFGARSPERTDWSPLAVAGLTVYIVPDHDKPGRDYARKVARLLANLNPAPTVKIVNLPDPGEGGDIEEWIGRLPGDWTRDQVVAAWEALAAASAGSPLYDGRPTEGRRAIDWLRAVLADGPIPSQALLQRATAAGFSERTIDRAKPQAGVRGVKTGIAWHTALDVEVAPPTARAAEKNASKSAKKTRRKRIEDRHQERAGDASKSANGIAVEDASKSAKGARKGAKPSNTYVEVEKPLLSASSAPLPPDPLPADHCPPLPPNPGPLLLPVLPGPAATESEASVPDHHPCQAQAPTSEPTSSPALIPAPAPAPQPTPERTIAGRSAAAQADSVLVGTASLPWCDPRRAPPPPPTRAPATLAAGAEVRTPHGVGTVTRVFVAGGQVLVWLHAMNRVEKFPPAEITPEE